MLACRSILLSIIMILTPVIFGTAFAGDLIIKVDKDNKIASITSSLPTNVTLLFLVCPDKRRLPLFGKLAPSKTVQVPLRFTMPKTVSHAVCEIADPPKGYEKELDNYYHLSVEII